MAEVSDIIKKLPGYKSLEKRFQGIGGTINFRVSLNIEVRWEEEGIFIGAARLQGEEVSVTTAGLTAIPMTTFLKHPKAQRFQDRIDALLDDARRFAERHSLDEHDVWDLLNKRGE